MSTSDIYCRHYSTVLQYSTAVMYVIECRVSVVDGNLLNMHIRNLHRHHLLKHLEGAFIRTFRNSNIVSFYQISVVCVCVIYIICVVYLMDLKFSHCWVPHVFVPGPLESGLRLSWTDP